MKKFRIKVDLSAFFNDERKLAHILIDPAWESVKSLQQRVEQIFEVDNVRFITNEGCFVPPQEPIQVIKTGDVLRAFIPVGDMKKKRKKDKSNNEVSVHYSNDEEKIKKRKREVVSKETVFTSSTPNLAKRAKSIVPFNAVIKNSTVNEITSTSEQLSLKYEKQKQTTSNLGTNVEDLATTSTGVNDASCQKTSAALLPERSESTKKRRRKQKTKNNQSLTKNDEPMDESENSIITEDAAPDKLTSCNKLTSCSGVPAATLRNTNKQKLSQIGHAYFDDTGETVSTTTENEANEKPAKIIFRCPVSEVSYDKPRVFSPKKTIPATAETENIQAAPETKKQSDVALEPTRMKSRSPVLIQDLLIIPNIVPTVSENKINKESPNGNETVSNQTEKSIANTTEQSEQETTTTKDDSSVIAIESENDDESEEENDKNRSKERDVLSEIIDLNASDDESQQSTIIVSADNERAERPDEKMSIDEMLPFSIVLEALPVSDEIIIFKLNRLDGKRSGYIAGKCQYINKRTKSLKLLVIDGEKELSGIPNKYVCSLDESIDTDKQYLQIKYNDLLEAKLFSVN